MDKKTIALVIVVCAVVFSVGIFAGRFIMPTETPVPTPTPISTPTPKPIPIATPSPAITPTSSFEIEYPVTAYWETKYGSCKVTLYEDCSASGKNPEGDFYGEWEIEEKTNSKIEYRVGYRYGTHNRAMYFLLFSNHDAILDPRHSAVLGYWR